MASRGLRCQVAATSVIARPDARAAMVIIMHTHTSTKIAPLPSKITYIKMDPENCIRNGFANGYPTHSHFYAACNSRHEPSMIPKALKFATLQKKMAPIPPHT